MEITHMEITRRGRFWAVHDGAGQLVCLAVYQKGAREVVRRLSPAPATLNTSLEQTGPAGSPALVRPALTRKEKPHGTRHASDDLHR